MIHIYSTCVFFETENMKATYHILLARAKVRRAHAPSSVVYMHTHYVIRSARTQVRTLNDRAETCQIVAPEQKREWMSLESNTNTPIEHPLL